MNLQLHIETDPQTGEHKTYLLLENCDKATILKYLEVYLEVGYIGLTVTSDEMKEEGEHLEREMRSFSIQNDEVTGENLKIWLG